MAKLAASLVAQDVSGQELPGTRDVQLVDILAVAGRNRRERRGQIDDALGGIGLGSPLGALVPALGWLLTSFVLTMPTAAGSVIVTNTAAGKWYLYGGAASAGLGVVLTFVLSRRGGWWPRRVGVWPR